MNPDRVSKLLFCSATVDPDILEFLASYEVDEDDDQAVQDVTEMCASATPEFAALSEEEATARVLAFLAELASAGDGTTATEAAEATRADPFDAAAAAAATALAAALKDLGCSTSNGSGRRTDDDDLRRRVGGGDDDEDGDEDDDDDATTTAVVDALTGLVPPGACADRAEARRFAAHALRERFPGDADAAADWLLSLNCGEAEGEEGAAGGGGGTAGAVADWRRLVKARKEAAEREALARERDRQATLDRFAWRPDAAGVKAPPEPAGGGAKANGGGGGGGGAPPRVRYIDGVPVTTRGEKYVVVSEKEEWDGGSRGRVKTKGKRGTGFA